MILFKNKIQAFQSIIGATLKRRLGSGRVVWLGEEACGFMAAVCEVRSMAAGPQGVAAVLRGE
ncbi:hypothetical protein ULG90_06305 [Halopseudomonas pachastrellae]|nr:hypothetical protein UMZ34_23970 [Halopseudomonas pachastrellae]WVM93517.1 hypothetical protein ULG90_06305 [Halopseudomonas pachastrellae]